MAPVKHGYCVGGHSRTYRTWADMLSRCNNPNTKRYDRYGGRGIKVCERWNIFEHFLEDMGEKPPNTSIDRINNDMGYCPANCWWAEKGMQDNNKSSNRLWTYKGKTQTLSQWAIELGLKVATLYSRFRAGWSVEEALSTPLHINNV